MSDDAKVLSNDNAGLDFDPDALRAKYLAERDKRLRADGNDQYVESRGRLPPLHRRSLRRPRLHPRAADRRGRRRWSSAAASAACWPARACARPGVERHPHHREGRRLRRHLVLEPLSRRAVRHRELHLPAAAGRDRLHPEGEVLLRAGDPASTAQRIGEHFDLYDDACFQTEVKAIALGRGRTPLAGHHQPRRRACKARFVVMSQRAR